MNKFRDCLIIYPIMAFESDKIMFEIYEDTVYNRKFRVVYYTELNENNKHAEINRAMAGNRYFDGFIKDYRKDEAKKIIEKIVDELNDGKQVSSEQIRERLKDYIP
jgi:thiaminase